MKSLSLPKRVLTFVVSLCLVCPVWAQPDRPVAPISNYPEVEGVLNQLRIEGKRKIADELIEKIVRAQTIIKAIGNKGHIIVGRVVLQDRNEQPLDPKSVNVKNVFAHMPILEDGHFAGAIAELNKPVGFGLHGYSIGTVVPGKAAQGQDQEDGDLLYVGDVALVQLQIEETKSVKGRIELEGAHRVEEATVGVSLHAVPMNSPSNSIEPRAEWPLSVLSTPDAAGEFRIHSFSPTTYRFAYNAPGYEQQVRFVNFAFIRNDELDLGTIRLKPIVK